ncbi:methyltransferase [Novosphingobium sp. 9U]|uniref:methyltransferase n=1 Tax=Novosphingobium sp. 9U TaxID=2653158 RepID=UPI0012F2BC8E|nr:methyltransferase [Novosphingobium sp. 9U]VWX54722.1 Methylase of polypeptide chain release factors [Novosphingobium sp. 9U]
MLTQIKDGGEHSTESADAWFTPAARAPLLALLKALEARGYDFVTATPATHARVLSRADRKVAHALRDVLGWSLPFAPDLIEKDLRDLLEAASALAADEGDMLRSRLRVSRVEGTLFLHSAYPTSAHDAVFLGPDSHRFAQLITVRMRSSAHRLLDYGAGAGVGGIVAARAANRAHLTLADVNPKALFLASINAEHAGVDHTTVQVQTPEDLSGAFDLMVTHPPFMIDADRRAYRDGGDLYGGQLSLDWTLQGAQLLAPGGQLILHTGVSIVEGHDVLLNALRAQLPSDGFAIDYRELDPDIFSEELDSPAYSDVERIAAVGLVLTRADG